MLTCDLHVLFFLTPVFHGIVLNPDEATDVFSSLSPEFLTVAAMIGITKRTFDVKDSMCLRFFGALALHDVVHEVPLFEVSVCVLALPGTFLALGVILP